MDCIFPNGKKGTACEVCGFVLPKDFAKPPRHTCGRAKLQRLLGDRLEELFSSVGITKENYKYAKQIVGLLPKCNCPKRIRKLNAINEYALEHGWLAAIYNARAIAAKVK